MPLVRSLAAPCLVVVLTAGSACASESKSGTADSTGAVATVHERRDATPDPGDPCTLVSRAEAEKYLGPLSHPPYRVREADGAPDERGSQCRYRTADGHRITVGVQWEDGELAMKMFSMGQELVGKVLGGNSSQTDTLDVAWDKVQWMAPGRLVALKGQVLLDINVASSDAGVVGASELAGAAIGRLAKRLAYDGAAAVKGAPPLAPLRDACTLLPRADVEAIVGKLGGEPTVSNAGSQGTCHLPLANGKEAVVAVKWRNGWEEYASGMATYRRVDSTLVQPTLHEAAGGGGNSLSEIQKKVEGDPDAKKVFGAMRGLMKQLGSNVEMQGAGFSARTDTAVAGPWAHGALLSGGGFMAVDRDVMMSVELRSVSFDQAKALVALAMKHL